MGCVDLGECVEVEKKCPMAGQIGEEGENGVGLVWRNLLRFATGGKRELGSVLWWQFWGAMLFSLPFENVGADEFVGGREVGVVGTLDCAAAVVAGDGDVGVGDVGDAVGGAAMEIAGFEAGQGGWGVHGVGGVS